MLPEYPKFKPLELEDKDLIYKYLSESPRETCELNVAIFYIWKEFDQPQLTLINKNLCLLLIPPNEPQYFLEPLGHNKLKETIDICLKHTGRICRASENFVSILPDKNYRLQCQRNHFDYIYLTRELAELKGRKFDGKRNHIKKFKQRHPDYKYIPLEPKHKKEALDLFEAWFEIRKESRFFPKLAHTAQRNAVENSFSLFEKLDLKGGAIYIDNTMKGFILGSYLNPEMVSVHFMYGHPALRGISQILLWEGCNKTFVSSEYVNLEQDLGIPGLRKSKLSYYPVKLGKKFEIKPLTEK